MAIHARSAGTLLRYTLKPVPAPVPISGDKDQDLRLELKIEAPTGQTAYCNKIQIRFLHGAAPEALSQTAPAEVYTGVEAASPSDFGRNWTPKRELIDGKAVFTFTNSRKLEFKNANTVTLVLSSLFVNKALGRVEIEVSEWTAATSSATPAEKQLDPPFPVDKWPSEFTFQNLRPDEISVARGEKVILTWEASRGPTYTMHWDDHSESVTGDLSWESPELERTTGFMLMAQLADPGGGAPLIYALTTAVTVTEPNLTVGDLEVNGVVRMQGPRAAIAAPPRGQARYFKAGTDGTILGYLQAASGQPAATLAATVYRAATGEYTMRFSSDNSAGPPTETPISIPVPADAEVRLYHAGNDGDTLNLAWLPRGAGTFDEITPPTA
ncbi:hypothetical protein ABZU75_31315 [Streptosporangium sp. NPDC005286]|uniref:hypothetical protein n=1 Tax=Streptosporangium sp. NPDC005286 TaxID=3154463 RepID=UPI0033B792EE